MMIMTEFYFNLIVNNPLPIAEGTGLAFSRLPSYVFHSPSRSKNDFKLRINAESDNPFCFRDSSPQSSKLIVAT